MNSTLLTNMTSLVGIIQVLGVVLGGIVVIMGLYRIAMSSRRPDYSVGGGIMRVVFGTLLVSLMPTLNLLSQSLLETNAPTSVLSYTGSGGPAPTSGLFELGVVALQVVGYFAFVRGLWMLAHSLDDRGMVGSAFVHVLTGVVCINIVTFLNLIGASIGTQAKSVISNIFGAAIIGHDRETAFRPNTQSQSRRLTMKPVISSVRALVSKMADAFRWPAQVVFAFLTVMLVGMHPQDANGQSISSVSGNVTNNLYAVGSIAKVLDIVLGAILVIIGLIHLSNHRKNKEPIGGSISMIVVGALLLSVSVVIVTMSSSIFGGDQTGGGNFTNP